MPPAGRPIDDRARAAARIDEAIAPLLALRDELLAAPPQPAAASGVRCAAHGWVPARLPSGECSHCWSEANGAVDQAPRPVPGTARNPRLRERFASARAALRSDGLPV